MSMITLRDLAVSGGMHFPIAFTAVYVVGFVAAISIGSLAWYNSRRPVGWEDAERPEIIPDLKDDEK